MGRRRGPADLALEFDGGLCHVLRRLGRMTPSRSLEAPGAASIGGPPDARSGTPVCRASPGGLPF